MGFRVRANIQACGGGGAGRPKTVGKSEESNILKLEYGLENLIYRRPRFLPEFSPILNISFSCERKSQNSPFWNLNLKISNIELRLT